MAGKLGKAFLLVLGFTLLTSGVVFAEDEVSHERVRCLGEMISLDLEMNTFTLLCNSGEELRFTVTEHTNFRSWNGRIGGIEELSTGMKALVFAVRDTNGDLIALTVATREVRVQPEMRRSSGSIVEVDIDEGSFLLETRNGEVQEFDVGSRTRYKSRDGSIHALSDIKQGMQVLVVALIREEQTPLALWLRFAESARHGQRFIVIGEIREVTPGQGTFELEARNGQTYSLSVTERTKFRSRDGSIGDIHDLEAGLQALVVGVRAGEDFQIALWIGVRYPAENDP